MSVLCMLAWFGAAAGLWFGAQATGEEQRRGYRWLAAAALLWCAGLVAQQIDGVLTGLSFADLPSLLAVAAAAVGIVLLNTRRDVEDRSPALPGLADGYVMAVALLVLGWITLFGAEFHHSGARPGTFLLDLIHPLADLAVLGALLPMVTTAWRRATLPYLALLAVAVSDSLAVGQRVNGGHFSLAAQLVAILAALLLGTAPWSEAAPRLTAVSRVRLPGMASAGAATVIAALTACVATIAVVLNGLVDAPSVGLALVIAGGAGVLVLAARVFMLVRENGLVLGMWRESSRNLRELASRTSDVVLVCDLAGTIRYASSAVAEYGYTPAELAGRRLTDLVHPEDRQGAVTAVRLELAAAPGEGRFPCRVRAADGTWRHIEATALRYDVPGADGQMLVTVRDVSDQVALRQQVAHLTFHDGLTGLPNRAYVEERARDVLSAPSTVRSGAGVIFLDLDRFTAVNDSVGHGAGDLVLAQAARRLRAAVPGHDTVARWGSDEFAVLVEQATGPQEITEVARRLAGAVASEPFRVAGQAIALTASVGVALAGADADQSAVVLRNADVAMSRAKDQGGDRVEVYQEHMHADAVRRVELVSDLQQAIANNELTLQYQPVVELATSRVVGAEALVRWRRAGEQVPPEEFLRAAEESGLIVGLGEWVLREACAQAAAWRRAGWDIAISVNASERQITAPSFLAIVSELLAEHDLPAAALTIEVNERILVEDAGLVMDCLAALRDLGVRLAIDDFGTGYASLANLRQLPADIIKIDPSFVDGLGRDDTLALLTRTVVQVGRELGMQVVAEGIEQPRQLTALREMGCGYGQGFLVARPMAAPGVEALIRTGVAPETAVVSACETSPAIG
ncbi:MAG TPA: GGDEF domain-containing protein [Streptosporangiaceae bacterium]|jgi:diguanylate cyclase (GGDEF)-like protein/PAS domain S-box-containing protein|nr:GGDEF domain-containing protein [Streptosporangiaceae bacterium]